MNITATIIKVNNFLLLDKYPRKLNDLIDAYFLNYTEIEKQMHVNNILTFLDNSIQINSDLKRVYKILSGKNPSMASGFIFGLQEQDVDSSLKTAEALA